MALRSRQVGSPESSFTVPERNISLKSRKRSSQTASGSTGARAAAAGARRGEVSPELARLGSFVCAYQRYLEQPVRRVLDIGCGFGGWQTLLAREFPKARYTGVEWSRHLCERHGWTHGSVVDFATRTPHDLVICSDVLQYLSDREASAAIENLARLCRGVLYFNLLTREDWEENCDRAATNGAVHLRRSAWYRRRLARRFTPAGGGLFVHADSPVILWELEKAGSSRAAR